MTNFHPADNPAPATSMGLRWVQRSRSLTPTTMGFLKKKPSIKVPNGGEFHRAQSKPSPTSANGGGSGQVHSPAPSTTSAPSGNAGGGNNNGNGSGFEDDRRDDGSSSGMWTDMDSRVASVAGGSKAGGGGGTAASATKSRASEAPSRASAKEAKEESRKEAGSKKEPTKKDAAGKATRSVTSAKRGGKAKPSSRSAASAPTAATDAAVRKREKGEAAAGARKSRSSRAVSPALPASPGGKLGFKKGPGSEKKKTTRGRHSLSPGRRSIRSKKPSADEGGKGGGKAEAKADGKAEGKAVVPAKGAKDRGGGGKDKKKPQVKSSASVRTEKTPRMSNQRPSSRDGRKKAPSGDKARPSSTGAGAAGRKQRPPPPPSSSRGDGAGRDRPASAPAGPSPPRRHGRRGDRAPATRQVRRQRSADESSWDEDDSSCSSGSYTGDEDSSYYSDTDTMGDSTLCTDASEFVSIGYSDSRTQSGSYTDASGSEDVTDSEGGEDTISRADRDSTSFESFVTKEDTVDGTLDTAKSTKSTKSNKTSRSGLLSKATRDSALASLGNIAKSAKKDKNKNKGKGKEKERGADDTRVDGDDAVDAKDVVKETANSVASPVNAGDDADEDDAVVIDEIADEKSSSKSSGGGTLSHPSAQSNLSTLPDFLKKMDGFTVKNHEHQLVVQVVEHGNVEKLLLQELSYIPQPNKPNEIVIKVDASTITLQDCMIRRGKWYEMQKLPFVPGSDFVGVIHEMGEEAKTNSTFQVGDKVAAVVPSGGNAKYITLPYHSIIRVPPGTDSVVALCLSSAYVPAREALDLARKLNTPLTSANILVIGGNGPSGLATIELALSEGANVFTTADERHHEFLTGIGAKCFPIDPSKWLPTLRGKMDVVLDSVCLDGYESSNLALNSAGTLVCTGMSAVYTQGQIPLWLGEKIVLVSDLRDAKAMYCRTRAKYMLNNTVYYDRMERYDLAPNEYAQHFRYLCHLASKDSIKPLVSSRSPLNAVARVQKAIEHGDTTYGVCVCTPWVASPADRAAEEAAEDAPDALKSM